MRKVTVKLEMHVVMLVDEGVEISDVVNELDYDINDTTTTADILDTEIIGYEVVDSK
jgi:hypothetical protein